MFADTDKRHAELRLKLRRDGISQVKFFQSIVTGYIENNLNIITFVKNIKEMDAKIGKKKIKNCHKSIVEGNALLRDFGFTEQDADFVFDLIEKGEEME